jgi:hypothetical protein
MSLKAVVTTAFTILVISLTWLTNASAQTCDPAICFTPTTSDTPHVEPVTSPVEIPVVVGSPPEEREAEFGVLQAADEPTPYSLAALVAGASTVLLTLFALVRNRRAFLALGGEPEPVPLRLLSAEDARSRGGSAGARHAGQTAFARSDQ